MRYDFYFETFKTILKYKNFSLLTDCTIDRSLNLAYGYSLPTFDINNQNK